ncbi:MAG: protein-glutamate O-methyltransferase CheR [Thermoanaerobaculia bacterium]
MTTPPVTMTYEEFQLLNEFISDLIGVSFPAERGRLLESRLRPRVQALHLPRFMDYYFVLQYDIDSEAEHLMHAVTNNETYFFRETRQFEALFDEVIGDLKAEAVTPGTIRLLCAGCSSGEEPYTIRMFGEENPNPDGESMLQIDAIDIDLERLEAGRTAEYGPNSLRSTSETQIQSYFSRSGSNRFKLLPHLRVGVRFSYGNILDLDSYPSLVSYDAVFCRNVLIYFSEAALHRALDSFARALRPGGLLFLGHSESIIGVTPQFEPVRLRKCIVYRKTGE